MSEPFLERLNQFTPDGGRLDRDGLIFAAGRGSARPNRRWQTLAGLLAGSQALSLFLLMARPGATTERSTMPLTALPAWSAPQSLATVSDADPRIWSARHSLEISEPEDRPADSLTLIDSGPPLRVFNPAPATLAN
jgi:hypothetical protein